MNLSARLEAAEQAILSLAQAEFGAQDGHPFYGNQHTQGQLLENYGKMHGFEVTDTHKAEVGAMSKSEFTRYAQSRRFGRSHEDSMRAADIQSMPATAGRVGLDRVHAPGTFHGG